jgi:hypothetical protein
MKQPLFDFDLKRASRENYITGKAAINFPDPGSTTGAWHFLSYYDRESGVARSRWQVSIILTPQSTWRP